MTGSKKESLAHLLTFLFTFKVFLCIGVVGIAGAGTGARTGIGLLEGNPTAFVWRGGDT